MKLTIDNLKIILLITGILIAGIFFSLFFPEYFLPFLTFLLLIFSLFFSKKIHGSFISPLGLFSLGWLVPALFNFLYGFYDPFWRIKTPLTWTVILITWILFFIAYFFTIMIFKRDSLKKPKEISWWGKKQFKLILFFLFGVGFVFSLLNLWRVFGTLNLIAILPIYLTGFRVVEAMWAGNPILNYFFFLNGLTFILGLVYLFTYGKEKKIIGITFLSFLMMFLLPIKTHIIEPLVIVTIIFLMLGFRPKLKHLVLGIIGIAVIFLLIDTGRALVEKNLTLEETSKILTISFKKIPLYMVQTYPNLEMELVHRDFTWGEAKGGLLTFGTTLDIAKYLFTGERLIQRGEPGKSVFGEIRYNLVKEGYNIGTFLRESFLDWGIGALIFLPIVLGVISTLFYLFFLLKRDFLSLFLFSLICYVLLFAWWNLKLFEIRFLWWGAWMVLFYFLYRPIKKIQIKK